MQYTFCGKVYGGIIEKDAQYIMKGKLDHKGSGNERLWHTAMRRNLRLGYGNIVNFLFRIWEMGMRQISESEKIVSF